MTLGATGFSGHTQRRRKYQPMIQDMPKISPAYAYRCEDCRERFDLVLTEDDEEPEEPPPGSGRSPV